MGWFSSKHIYKAYAGSSDLFQEQPNSLKQTILQSTIDPDSPPTSASIQWVIGTDFFARAKAMMRYAERYEDPTKEGGYVRGFPEASLNIVRVQPDRIEAAMTKDGITWDSIETVKAGKYDELFFMERALQELYPTLFDAPAPTDPVWYPGLATIDIPVVNPIGGSYYNIDNTPIYTRPSGQWDWGDRGPYSGYQDATAGTVGLYDITFDYRDSEGDAKVFGAGRVDITPYITGEWVQVKYLLNGVTYYWIYEVGSNDDPDFEKYIETESKYAKFLPVAMLQQDKVWFNADPNSDLAITTNKLLKKFATSGDEIRTSFEEEEEENPLERGEFWDFMIHFAVPLDSDKRGSMEYAWYFFDEMRTWSTFDATDYYDYLASAVTIPWGPGVQVYTKAQPMNEINITEGGITGYNVDYAWSYIHKTDPYAGFFEVENTNTNKYGTGPTRPLKEGEVHVKIYTRKAIGFLGVAIPAYRTEGYTEAIENAFGVGTPIGAWQDGDEENLGYHDLVVITRQKKELKEGAPPTGEYEQILVMGLDMRYRINTSTDSGDYRFRYADPTLDGTEEETKEFRIPLLYNAVRDMPTLHREEAITAGMTGTVFLVDHQKVSWYQRGVFRWIWVAIAIALIVLAIFYPGFWTIVKAYAAAFAAVFAVTSALVIMAIYAIFTFAIHWIIAQAGAVIGQEFGGMAAAIFAVVAAFAMANFNFGNISTAWTQMTGNFGWSTALNFANVINPIYNAGFQVVYAYKAEQYKHELEDLMKDYKERQQELEDAWDTLHIPAWLDPLELAATFKRVGENEDANTYYARTLMANPTYLGYDAIADFANIGTMLPQGIDAVEQSSAMFLDLERQRG